MIQDEQSQILEGSHLFIVSDTKSSQYTPNKFVQLLMDLSKQSILYYSPYTQSTLLEFYQQIKTSMSVQYLTQDMVRQFVIELKESNIQNLNKQITFYRQELRKQMNKGVTVMSRKQFLKMTDRIYFSSRLLTDLLIDNAKRAQFLSCPKIQTFIQQVEREIYDSVVPDLTVSKLQAHSLVQKSSQISSYVKVQSVLFKNLQQYEVNNILADYMTFWKRKMVFYKEFIVDSQVKDDIAEVNIKVARLEEDLVDQIRHLIQLNTQLKDRCRKFDSIVEEFGETQEMYEKMTKNQQERLVQAVEQLKQTEKQNTKLKAQNLVLSQNLQQIRAQLLRTFQNYSKIEQEMQQYKKRYETLVLEYSKTMQQKQQKSFIHREQQSKKIFANRSIKEELQDTVQRFNRLLKQRQKEKSVFLQKQKENNNKIDQLQIRVQQLQNELKAKQSKIGSYIRQSRLFTSRIQDMRTSNPFRYSKRQSLLIRQKDFGLQSYKMNESKPNPSSLVDLNLTETVKAQISESRVRSVDIFDNQSPRKMVATGRVIDINAIEQEDQSHIVENSDLHEQQNILKVIEQDKTVIQKIIKENMPSPVKWTIKQAQANLNQQAMDSNIGYFMSKATIINVYGVKFQTTLLLNAYRLCYFDTKVRLDKYLPLQNIKSIMFGKTNPNIVVVKPIHVKQLNPKKHLVYDMIFFVRNRNELLTFITKKLAPFLKYYGIKVFSDDQSDTFVQFNNSDYNLKVKVPNLYNPFRIALSGQKVYYATVQQLGFLSPKREALLIIQSIGILIFEGTETNQLDANRQFLYLLPVTDQISFWCISKEFPDRKLKLDYAQGYDLKLNILFPSKEDLKSFVKAAKTQLIKNNYEKAALMKQTNKDLKKALQ